MLGTNRLGGEKRSAGYDCGNWKLGAFTQDYATLRQLETGEKVPPLPR
jgi:hypothetical protein